MFPSPPNENTICLTIEISLFVVPISISVIGLNMAILYIENIELKLGHRSEVQPIIILTGIMAVYRQRRYGRVNIEFYILIGR